MRFKRPQVRYSTRQSPSPPTRPRPRSGTSASAQSRVQAKNWRLDGLRRLVAGAADGRRPGPALGAVHRHALRHRGDHAGQVRAVGEATAPYKPADAQIAFHLARFIARRALAVHRSGRGPGGTGWKPMPTQPTGARPPSTITHAQ